VTALRALCAVGAILGLLLLSQRAEGQGSRRTNLTITGFPLSVASTTIAQFDAAAILIGSTTFTVDLRTNNGGGGFSPRVTTVQVNCLAPCPATGTLPVGSLQWRRTDLAAWSPLTTAPVTVETRTAAFNGANDPWSNSMQWRYAANWENTPPGAASFRIQYQLVVTAP
jgi:hypothetical protein